MAASVPWAGVARLGAFEQLGDAVADLKYRRRWRLGQHMGQRLARVVQVEFPLWARNAQAVVPMPMPWRRRRQRGIDHAAVMGASLARSLEVPLRRYLKRGSGPRQTGRTRAARLQASMPGLGLARCGQRHAETALRGLGPVILVDDVLTTGRSCTSACRALGCSSVLIAVAAVANPGKPA
ncbi:MAG: hypothetical protein MK101_11480 [Phycisphaerales bacterium]|nr:hypothetical protein [Phycisphaerales bacterium]